MKELLISSGARSGDEFLTSWSLLDMHTCRRAWKVLHCMGSSTGCFLIESSEPVHESNNIHYELTSWSTCQRCFLDSADLRIPEIREAVDGCQRQSPSPTCGFTIFAEAVDQCWR